MQTMRSLKARMLCGLPEFLPSIQFVRFSFTLGSVSRTSPGSEFRVTMRPLELALRAIFKRLKFGYLH